MTTRMLIDGRHPEETRVAVVKGNRIEEFDFEAASKKQIKGNIYLAKVTRVEPSLQAAFIDYGGNRHGFLAFSEIHPDYYQIPKEDREALLREEQRLAEQHGHDDDHEDHDHGDAEGEQSEDGAAAADDNGERGEAEPSDPDAQAPRPEEHGNTEEAGAEALRRRRMALRRRYKIQEVIRRRQVMLVQVVKEERGNKGAALTTYISLAGRYSVLMPNTAQGGGISRKIANAADRKRLKTIMAELDLPSTMGAIVRTAGLARTKTEIRRDFDYLARLWDEIRENTLKSSAPALIYEDSDLVKRAIRDIYSRDIDEVLVDGEEPYRQAKDFMKLLMPSHARRVQPYNDPVPLFHRAGVESQLAALMNPVVNLKSGGYLVINPTEALVAVDVNSGRSTKEYNIEETALKTNIEAAEEVARQLRLRDMAGLVVVDFIDMDVHANNRKVERALKEALKHDRARIQVGRISSFGLLEMSRQRLRTGVLEASTRVCPTCEGTGLVLTDGSAALAALRLLEEDAVRGRASLFRLRADHAVAFYILNRKRPELADLESRYGITVEVVPDDALSGGRVQIDASGPPPAQAPRAATLAPLPELAKPDDEPDEDIDAEEADSGEGDQTHAARESEAGEGGSRQERRNGRRRRRPRRDRGRTTQSQTEEQDQPTAAQADDAADDVAADMAALDADTASDEGAPEDVAPEAADGEQLIAAEQPAADVPAEDKAEKPRRRRRSTKAASDEVSEAAATDITPEPATAEATAEVSESDEAEAKPAPRTPRRRRTAAKPAAADASDAGAEEQADVAVEDKPKRATRRRKADTDKAAEKIAEKTADEAADAGAAEKPKPRRTTRARTVVKPATKAEAAEAPAAEPEVAAAPVAPVPVVAAEPVAPVEAAEPTADVAAETPQPEATEAQPAQPARTGWWSRTFGNR